GRRPRPLRTRGPRRGRGRRQDVRRPARARPARRGQREHRADERDGALPVTTPPNPTPPGGTTTDGDPFDADATRSLRAEPAPADPDAAATVQLPPVERPRDPGDDGVPDDGGSTTTGGSRRTRKRLLIGGGALVGLLALLYVVDLLVSATDVPRGVTVAGVEIGGMNRLAAENALRS